MQEWIVVGTVTRPHGVRGEVKVLPLTDMPGRFRDLDEVAVEDRSGTRRSLRVDRVRFQGKWVLVHFAGVDGREKAADLAGARILVHRSKAVPLPPGRYYHADIIGLAVRTDEGRDLGRVEEIWETGSNDVYVVRGEGREVLVPAIESVVRRVDLEEGILVIHAMEGLLD